MNWMTRVTGITHVSKMTGMIMTRRIRTRG